MDEKKKEKTCEQRISERLSERLERLFPEIDDWSVLRCARFLRSEGHKIETTDIEKLRETVLEIMRDHAYEPPLSVEKFLTYKIWLSCVGPADYFELDWSEQSQAWVGGTYIFEDSFHSAKRFLTRDQAEQIAQIYGIDPEGG